MEGAGAPSVRDHEVGQARLEEAAKHRRQIKEGARRARARARRAPAQNLRARGESRTERVRAAEASLGAPRSGHRQRLAAEHETLREPRATAQQGGAARVVRRPRSPPPAGLETGPPTGGAPARGSHRGDVRHLGRARQAEGGPRRACAGLAALARARREAAEARQNAGEHATATDILERSCARARAADAARDALEKRGVPLPWPPRTSARGA